MQRHVHGDGTRPSLPSFQFTEPGTRKIRLQFRTTGSKPRGRVELADQRLSLIRLDCLVQFDKALPTGAAAPMANGVIPSARKLFSIADLNSLAFVPVMLGRFYWIVTDIFFGIAIEAQIQAFSDVTCAHRPAC